AALWQVLAEAHRPNLIATSGSGDEARAAKLAILQWARTVLESRPVSVEELAAARKLWIRNARFDKRPDVRAAAEELEELYRANDLAREFEPLVGSDDWEGHGAAGTAKAETLATDTTPEAITGFLVRATEFLGS